MADGNNQGSKDDNELPEWFTKWVSAHKGLTALIACGVVAVVAAVAIPLLKGVMADIDQDQADYAASQKQDSASKASEPADPPKPTDDEVPAAFKNDPGLVTQDKMGAAWPLTVPFGAVDCRTTVIEGVELQSVTFRVPHMQYALNGTAKTHSPFPDIDPIWADDPEVKGLKIDISPLVDKGLTLC